MISALEPVAIRPSCPLCGASETRERRLLTGVLSLPKEIAATNVISLPIADGDWVYKVNGGPVAEPEEETDAWAGIVPFSVTYGEPQRAEWSTAELPDSVRAMVTAAPV